MNDLELLTVFFTGKAEVKGVEFEQLHSSDKAYMYRRTEDGNVIYYEVFTKKQVNKFDFETNTQLEEMKEIYPKSNDFGKWAWCFRDYERAFKRFEELSNGN